MRSLRPAVAGRLLQNLHESGDSRVLDYLQLALALVLMCASSSSARCTLELYILIQINSPVSMDRCVLFFLFRKSSVPP
jgi:hypothetical protein